MLFVAILSQIIHADPLSPMGILVQKRGVSSLSFQRDLTPLSASPKRIKIIQIKNRRGLQVQGSEEPLRLYEFEVGSDIEALSEEINGQADVVYAEPLYPVQIFQTPNDTGYAYQDYLKESSLKFLDYIPENEGVVVAVLDTGVDRYHEDLSLNMWQNIADPINGLDDDGNGFVDDLNGYNFCGYTYETPDNDPMDQHSHGTHLSGLISAEQNNSIGIAGINSKTKIMAVKFLDERGYGNQLDAAMAIRYAVDNGADIINCSWGFYRKNTVLEDAMAYAESKGVIVIAAMGNTNTNLKEYPAAFSSVWAIGASSDSEERAHFSSIGEHIDFSVPGQDIYSLINGNSYGFKSGTSQSSAIMTGIVAKLLSNNPEATKSELYTLLKSVSTQSEAKDLILGYGIPDIEDLLLKLNLTEVDEEETVVVSFVGTMSISRFMNYPNPIIDSTTFGFESNESGAEIEIVIYNQLGDKVDSLSATSSSGYNKISWTPDTLLNGTYFYRTIITGTSDTYTKKGKLIVLQ